MSRYCIMIRGEDGMERRWGSGVYTDFNDADDAVAEAQEECGDGQVAYFEPIYDRQWAQEQR